MLAITTPYRKLSRLPRNVETAGGISRQVRWRTVDGRSWHRSERTSMRTGLLKPSLDRCGYRPALARDLQHDHWQSEVQHQAQAFTARDYHCSCPRVLRQRALVT